MIGILPEILFPDKSMLCSIFNALMLAWRIPSNELNDKSKNNRFSRLHKLDGIDEDSWLELMNMICKLKRFAMRLGIGQDRLFFCKAISSNLARRQIFVGMLCSSWFPCRYNLCRLFIPLIVDGMVPLKLLSLSVSMFKFLKAPIPFGIGPFMLHDSAKIT